MSEYRCGVCHEPFLTFYPGSHGKVLTPALEFTLPVNHPEHTDAELAETKAAVDAAGLILATDAMLWLTAQMARSA